MELVWTDANGTAQGFVDGFTMDMAFGNDENDFEITVPADFEVPIGGRIFEPDTEVGGVVRGMKLRMTDGYKVRTIIGRTWHGILADKVIRPAAGADYFTVSGDINACIKSALTNIGMDAFFDVGGVFGKSISHQFKRYVDAYSGLCGMLAKNGCKLGITASIGEKPKLSAMAAGSYVDDGSTEGYGFRLTGMKTVNHLVCLGNGELSERTVIDLYVASDGSISQLQHYFGIDEVAEVYEQSSAEHDELLESGTKKLRELLSEGKSAELELPDGASFDIGDTVGIHDMELGISLSATVTKLIIRVDENGTVERTNEIGEVSQ